MAAKDLFVANEVGLFEKFPEGPATLDDLKERIGIPRRTICIVVDAKVALGFVERQGDHYQNGSVADSFLSGRNPTDLRLFLRYFNRLVSPTWMKLEEAVPGRRLAAIGAQILGRACEPRGRDGDLIMMKLA